MNIDLVVTIVRDFIREHYGAISDSEQLDIDSLGVVEIIVMLESELGRDFPESELSISNFRDFDSIRSMIERLSGA